MDLTLIRVVYKSGFAYKTSFVFYSQIYKYWEKIRK